MKHVLNNILSFFILISIFGVACTERMDPMELEAADPVLVVYGGITTDTMAHSVRLTKSDNYFANKATPAVSGADVKIDVMTEDSSIEETITLKESDDEKGIYYTDPDFFGRINKIYHLSIDGVDIDNDGENEKYEAYDNIDSAGKIDSIKLKYFDDFIEGWEIKVYAWDPPEKNYYLFKAMINDTLVTDTLDEWFIQDDIPFNGNYTNGIGSQYLQFHKKGERTSAGDKVTFELNNISAAYYNFIATAQTEAFPKVPIFSGPPANVTTNLTNGAFGFFYAYATARCSTIAREIPGGDKGD